MRAKSQTIIFYDVDGTLAEPFQSPPQNLLKILRSLDRVGVKQVLCSGKSKDYLSGLARVLGLTAATDIIAENGGVIFDWKRQHLHKINENAQQIKAIKPKVARILKKYQHFEESKDTIATYFIKDLQRVSHIAKEVEKIVLPLGFTVKYYEDGAMDIFSGTTHKGSAVDYYLKKFAPDHRVYTCGDATNDLEMLAIGTPITFLGASPEVIELVISRNGHVADKIGPDGVMQAISRLVFNEEIPDAINYMDFIYRDWGSWEILSAGQDFKVKKMVVSPKSRLSLQKHQHRSEHWFIFEGLARVTLNGKEVELSAGEDFYIPQKSIHRIENASASDLIIIEVQRGSYLGEDDIIRYEI